MLLLEKNKNKKLCLAAIRNKDWSEFTIRHLFRLRNSVGKMKKSGAVRKCIEGRFLDEMRTRNIDIKEKYFLKVPIEMKPKNRSLDIKFKYLVKQKLLEKNCEEYFANYFFQNIKIVYVKTSTIGKIIKNHNKFSKNFDLLNGEKLIEDSCSCHKYPELINEKFGHVHIKANDLHENYNDLKKLLKLNAKTPVNVTEKEVTNKLFEEINELIKKVNKNSEIIQTELNLSEEEIKNTFTFYKNGRISASKVKEIANKYNDLVFCELDKNTSALSISCPALYLESLQETYSPTYAKNYELINKEEEEVLNIISEDYVKKGLQKISRQDNDFTINKGRIIYKNKDINRVRPLVSYYKSFGRRLGKRVSRALMIMIK